MKQNNIRAILEKHPVIPVITFDALDQVEPQLQRLQDQGVNCIEITLRTPVSFDAIAHAKKIIWRTNGYWSWHLNHPRSN